MHSFLFRRPPDRPRSRGQSLAEFALVFPVLMLILGGVVQFGIIFWGQNSLNQVVRDAGRYAVTEQGCLPPNETDVDAKITALSSVLGVAKLGATDIVMPTNGEPVGAGNDPISDDNGTPTPNFCPPNDNKDHVWIRITINAQVPIFFPFVPGNGNISSSALFRMEPINP